MELYLDILIVFALIKILEARIDKLMSRKIEEEELANFDSENNINKENQDEE